MAAQGIDPSSAGYRSNEEIYAQWKGGGSSSSTGGKSKTVKVQANGKAPAGLSAGDKVETAGGTYEITGVKADGSYDEIVSKYLGEDAVPSETEAETEAGTEAE